MLLLNLLMLKEKLLGLLKEGLPIYHLFYIGYQKFMLSPPECSCDPKKFDGATPHTPNSQIVN